MSTVTPECAGCGQRLLLTAPTRTHCARCKNPWEHAGWVGDAYSLDTREPQRLAALLPAVLDEVAEAIAARRVTTRPTDEETQP